MENSFFIKEIHSNFPDFPLKSAEKLGEGMMSTALLVNDEWVFRFAKNEKASSDLNKEIRVLPQLKKLVTIAVPEFEFTGRQENGLLFVGYRLLPGELLKEDAVLKMNIGQKKRLASQLAQFIKEVQSFPIKKAFNLGVEKWELNDFYKKIYEEAVDELFPHLDHRLAQYISSRFEGFLNNPVFVSSCQVFLHGDLSPDHFLIDPDTGDLTGIIDFGDLSVSDPDHEFIYILEDGGENFTRKVLKEMRYPDIENCIQKISYFVTFSHIRYALEGNRQGKTDWIEEAAEEIRQEMKNRS
ncbi:phosphotransferase family protein [Halobacillus massiliensis]|uniref:phosphotransferase family protein n=1 Tax=Halobacillus massiliensis TaxID=1926286 RepID=UPI0015C4A7F1|nr:aminoglycoside phosphotransferase family protein [Halobacillus massiliensis]